MRTVSFTGNGVLLVTDIPFHGMMEKLHHSYSKHCDEIVQILGKDLNRRMNQFSYGKMRCVHIMIGMIRPFKLILLD